MELLSEMINLDLGVRHSFSESNVTRAKTFAIMLPFKPFKSSRTSRSVEIFSLVDLISYGEFYLIQRRGSLKPESGGATLGEYSAFEFEVEVMLSYLVKACALKWY